jgi:hypothetical protein
MEAMDMMDPRRRLRHNVQLLVGYALVGIALVLMAVILLFVAYGFGLQNGRVIQSGLLFISSTPNPAAVYLDDARYQNNTNTKLLLPEATYQVALRRDGYRDWQRPITVVGGAVEQYTYPFLFPVDLTTTTMQRYASAPSFITESSDQHWLLAAHANSLASFDLYDLTSPRQAPTALTLPGGLLTASAAKQSLAPIEWADDNDHLLLEHTYGGNMEYVLLDRSSPAQSRNLTKALDLPTSGVSLRLDDHQQDHYLVLDTAARVLSRISLGTPTLSPLLSSVLSYAADTDNGNVIVYATPDPANQHQTNIMIFDGSRKLVLRHGPAGDHYLLAAADYNGNTYVTVSAKEASTAYVYKNPIAEITDPRLGVAVPAQAFTINNPTYTGFSVSGQYGVFESGARFAVYDAANDQGFNYTVDDTLDAPMTHARWMDEARLYYVSRGQIIVFDYDGRNRQPLVPADPRYPLIFDDNYKFLYAFAKSSDAAGQELLTSTSLRTKADQ